ncbi:MAG: hypothetical protein WCT20_05735, partial [Candidatus Babeliales bacterium]
TFLDELATHIFELTPTGINRYEGNYSSYLYYKSLQQNPSDETTPKAATQQAPKKETVQLSGKQLYERQKKVRSLEAKLEKLEAELVKLAQAQSQLEFGSPAFEENVARTKQVKESIKATYQEWEALQG